MKPDTWPEAFAVIGVMACPVIAVCAMIVFMIWLGTKDQEER